MFLYSLFLVETTAFYRQDIVQPHIEPVSYTNYTFSRWQIHSCLPAPDRKKTDTDGGQNVGFGSNSVSSKKRGFGFDLKTDPALLLSVLVSFSLHTHCIY